MSPKQHTELLSPISKLLAHAESTDKKVDSMVNGVLLLVKNSSETHKEVKTQTGLLTDIKQILLEIKESSTGKGKAPKGAGMGLSAAMKIGGFMVLSAMALAASSYFLKGVVPVSATQLVTAIAISFAMIGITRAFLNIYQALRPIQSIGARVGHFALDKAKVGNKFNPISQKSALGMTFAIIIGSVLSIAFSSVILQMVMPVSPIQVATAFLIGIALTPMVGVFVAVVKSMRKGGIRPNKKGLKTIGMAGLALMLITVAIAGVALALQLLPPSLVEPPSIMWVLQTGLMLYVFSFSFAKIIKATKGMSTKDIIKAGFVFPLMAIAIIGVAKIFGAFKVNYDSAPPVEWSLTAGLAILVFGLGFMKLAKSLKNVSLPDLIKGVAGTTLVALSIVGVSYIFEKLGSKWIAPPLKWTLKSGLAILAFGIGFVKITNALKRTSFKDIVKGTVAVGLVALAIVGVNFIFQYLVDSWSAPPVDWTLKSGLAILAFGISFALLTKVLSNVSIKGIAMGLLGTVAVAVGILAVGWIFTLLDGVSFVAPPMDWALKAAIAVTVFAIPVLVIGLIATSGVGAVGILLGVVGMIVIAAGMLAVAWIFNYMPDLGAIGANITAGLLAPVNGIVDVLKRFKEEIGVENLLPLAGGIVAISGSLLVLAGATAGVAAAGLGSALAGVGTAFLNWVSGEEKAGPMEILLKLADNANKILQLADPLNQVAASFVTFSKYASVSQVKSINALIQSAIMPIGPEDAASLGITSIQDYMKVYASSINKIASAYGKISKYSNEMNVEAINASTQMFNALAYLASVGKDDALAKLGDSLIAAVKELALMISDFEGTVKEAGEQNTQVGSSIGGFVDGIKDAANNLLGGGSQQQQPTNVNVDVDVDEIVDAIETLKAVLTTKGIRIQA